MWATYVQPRPERIHGIARRANGMSFAFEGEAGGDEHDVAEVVAEVDPLALLLLQLLVLREVWMSALGVD